MIEKLIELINQGHINCSNVYCNYIKIKCCNCPLDRRNYGKLLKELKKLQEPKKK